MFNNSFKYNKIIRLLLATILILIYQNALLGQSKSGTFTDLRDGKEYKWVKIGSQTWMAENLAYLPKVNPSNVVVSSNDLKILNYVHGYNGTNADEAKTTENYKKYGVLYTIMGAAEACPAGWHVPELDEWKILAKFVKDNGVYGNWEDSIGLHVKARNGWNSWLKGGYYEVSSGNGIDGFGFSALPGGIIPVSNDNYEKIGEYGNWWTATGSGRRFYSINMANCLDKITQMNRDFNEGLSVRCVKD